MGPTRPMAGPSPQRLLPNSPRIELIDTPQASRGQRWIAANCKSIRWLSSPMEDAPGVLGKKPYTMEAMTWISDGQEIRRYPITARTNRGPWAISPDAGPWPHANRDDVCPALDVESDRQLPSLINPTGASPSGGAWVSKDGKAWWSNDTT